MEQYRISGLPVTKGDQLVGIVTNRDLRFETDMEKIIEGKTKGEKIIKKAVENQIEYFLAALTIQESDLWVNLSPYEKDRIIPEALSSTKMGRDMLAQDYILKQISSIPRMISLQN